MIIQFICNNVKTRKTFHIKISNWRQTQIPLSSGKLDILILWSRKNKKSLIVENAIVTWKHRLSINHMKEQISKKRFCCKCIKKLSKTADYDISDEQKIKFK